MYYIENEFLKASADNKIGELHSITSKKTGKEYLWNGNPDFWAFHAPLLFPVIGGLKDGRLMVDGKQFELTKHGFVRASTFEVIEKEADKLTFMLTESQETLKSYPFKFIFNISYSAKGNGIETKCEIKNTDDKDIYFSIGGHPALMCPFNDGDKFEDYYLEFEQKENATHMLLNAETLMSHKEEPFLSNESIIPLTYDLFKDDAVVLKNLKSKHVMLKSKNSKNYIQFGIEGFPYLGIWTKIGAPFLCIEPWYGHADFEDFTREFKDKAGIITLSKGKSFMCSYTFSVHE